MGIKVESASQLGEIGDSVRYIFFDTGILEIGASHKSILETKTDPNAKPIIAGIYTVFPNGYDVDARGSVDIHMRPTSPATVIQCINGLLGIGKRIARERKI